MEILSENSARLIRKACNEEVNIYDSNLPWKREIIAEISFHTKSPTETDITVTFQSDPSSESKTLFFFYLRHDSKLKNINLKEFSTASDFKNGAGEYCRHWSGSSEKWPTGGSEKHSEHAHPQISYEGHDGGRETRLEGIEILGKFLHTIDREIGSQRGR